jgi:predicted metallo-beta-lactamase superfamily hydrolase
MNKTGENIRENVKISAKESLGYYKLKQHKPWFDEECSESADKRKQFKLQWTLLWQFFLIPNKINKSESLRTHCFTSWLDQSCWNLFST